MTSGTFKVIDHKTMASLFLDACYLALVRPGDFPAAFSKGASSINESLLQSRALIAHSHTMAPHGIPYPNEVRKHSHMRSINSRAYVSVSSYCVHDKGGGEGGGENGGGF